MVGFAQAQGAFVLGSSSYDNRLFDPRANPDALHATNAQPPAVTFFNGSVGAFGGSGTSQCVMISRSAASSFSMRCARFVSSLL